jgi:hypothetical protein
LFSTSEHLAACGAVITFLFGVWRYVDAKWRESRKTFLERQFALYFQATKLASELATMAEADPSRDEKVRAFWRLYWGELCIVEDSGVEDAMEAFGEALAIPTRPLLIKRGGPRFNSPRTIWRTPAATRCGEGGGGYGSGRFSSEA